MSPLFLVTVISVVDADLLADVLYAVVLFQFHDEVLTKNDVYHHKEDIPCDQLPVMIS